MTIFPEFERQLLEHATAAAGADHPARGIRPWRRVLAAAGSLVMIAIAVIVVAFISDVHVAPHPGAGHPRPPLTRTSPPGHVSSALSADFSVFRRPATRADMLPAGFGEPLSSVSGGMRPQIALSRRVIASDGQTAYLVPAQTGVCVINTNEAFCAPIAAVAGADAVDLCSPTLPAGQIELEWLLPDDMRNVALTGRRGTAIHFPPGRNVYIAHLSLNGPLPTTITWQDVAGQTETATTSIPPDAQHQRCAHPTPASGAP